MHTMNHMKGKTRAFVIKVDLNKAYDNLNWQFMEKILNEVGIPNQIKRAIMNAISTVKMKVLWNGNDCNLFEIRKGLRQGDPISPYIVVLCLDTLPHMIKAVVGNGNWIGLKARRKGPMISHLMFVNDLLLFGKATNRHMVRIKQILNDFCGMSG